MHLLFIIDNLSTGGAQRQMANLALGLTSRKHTVEFFVYSVQNVLAAPLIDAGITIHTFPAKDGRFSWASIKKVRNLIQTGRYDIVLSFLTTPNFLAVLSSIGLAKRPRVIVSERNTDPPQGVGLKREMQRFFYHFSDAIVVNSSTQSENFSKIYPLFRKKIFTIYNGLNLEQFSYQPKIDPHQPPKILVISSVLPRKNGLCLIEALHILRDSHQICPSVTWVGEIIKYGEAQLYYRKMEDTLEKYGLVDQWSWYGQRNDIVDLLHAHDVLVHPSNREGLPNAVCEAMACGCPVVVSSLPEHTRIIVDGETGFLFDWRNPEELANKIIQYLSLSNEDRLKMVGNGREFVENNLSLDKMVDSYESMFKSFQTN